MAETEGFEPSIGLLLWFLSRELVSATHPRLRIAAAKRDPITAVIGTGKGVSGGFLTALAALLIRFALIRTRLVDPALCLGR